MRIHEAEPKPLGDLVEMRAHTRSERRCVQRGAAVDRASVEVPPQVGRHVERRLITAGRIALHRRQCDRLQRLRDRRVDLDRQPRRAGTNPIDHHPIVAVVRRATAQELVQDHAERIHIGPRIDWQRRVKLLGGHVGERADEMAACRVAGAQAEIEDARRQLCIEHDVRRLEVAMLQAERVRVVHGVADIEQDPGPLCVFERRTHAAQLEPVDELHDDHGWLPVEAALVDLDNAAIGEEGERAGFAQKPVDARLPAAAAVPTDDFARHDPVEPEVSQLEDLAHPAGPDALDGLKAVEGRQRSRVGRGRDRQIDGRRQRLCQRRQCGPTPPVAPRDPAVRHRARRR